MPVVRAFPLCPSPALTHSVRQTATLQPGPCLLRGRVILYSPRRTFTCQPSTLQQKQRQSITLHSKDPSSKKWNQLTRTQKFIRTTTTSGSLLTIIAGVALTATIFTLLYNEVLAPDSVTNWFNRAVDRVKGDPRSIALLGRGGIKAYGEPTSNKWSRNRPIASQTRVMRNGNQELLMRFNVEGTLEKGVVHVRLVKRPGHDEYEYKYLFLDVPGQPRLYLENADEKPETPKSQKKGLFGVRWGG